MAKPSGLDFSNVSHVRVWHEQFEKIKNKGEFLIVEDKSNGKCVSFTSCLLYTSWRMAGQIRKQFLLDIQTS